MRDYQGARQAVSAALRNGGFTAVQADAAVAMLEQFLEQFFEAKLAQVLAAVPQQPPSPSRWPAGASK